MELAFTSSQTHVGKSIEGYHGGFKRFHDKEVRAPGAGAMPGRLHRLQRKAACRMADRWSARNELPESLSAFEKNSAGVFRIPQ